MTLLEALRGARYLAFGGCAVKGVAYMGCLRALQRHHPGHADWHRRLRGTCGTSSGCLAAIAFLVDADVEDLIARWRALRVETVVPFVDFNTMFSRYGVDAGGEVKRIVREVFTACGLAHDTNFRTLHRLTGRDLRICVTNLSRCRLEIFSHVTTPDVIVADAVYWSMTVPFVFQPETYRGDLMVDGCVLSYVPHDVWPVEESMIFHVSGVSTGSAFDERRDICDLRSFATSVMACCARSVLKAVHEKAASHPDHFVQINVKQAEHDSLLTISDATFDALVDMGFSTVFFRMHPEVAVVLDSLVRMNLELACRIPVSDVTDVM